MLILNSVAAPVTAAPRTVRAVAGRRAVQVLLFLGGLLALGFLYGGQAHASGLPGGTPHLARGGSAASSPAAAASTVAGVRAGESSPIADGQRAAHQAQAKARTQASAPGSGAGSVADAGRVVRRVARPVRELPQDLSSVVPVHTGQRPPAATSPEPSRHTGPGRKAAAEHAVVHRSAAAERRTEGGAGRHVAVSGPFRGPVAATYSYREVRKPGSGARCGDLPGQQPCGPPAPHGMTGPDKRTAEGSGPGSGVPCAVPVDGGGAKFALLRGAGLPDVGAPTRERAHDILEFPG